MGYRIFIYYVTKASLVERRLQQYLDAQRTQPEHSPMWEGYKSFVQHLTDELEYLKVGLPLPRTSWEAVPANIT